MPTFRANSDVAIHVTDLAAAHAFYGGVLGFALLESSADHLAFDAGSFRLWVNRASDRPISFIPSLNVVDAGAARDHLQRAGCTIEREAADGSGFYFRDPFGFVVDVVQRGRTSAG